MPNQSHKCPECGSEDFITQPNRYDVMTFTGEKFELSDSHCTDDQEVYYCRECSKEVNIAASVRAKRIILA